MLKNLIVDNYRLFEHFEIPALSRVNLIVGTNNAGKSSLLEAIHLLTSDDVRSSLIALLNERGEYVSGVYDPRGERRTRGGYQISHIFNNHTLKLGHQICITSNEDRNLTLKLAVAKRRDEQPSEIAQTSSLRDEAVVYMDVETDSLILEHIGLETKPQKVTMHLDADGLIDLRRYSKISSSISQVRSGISQLITTNFLGYDELSVLWDRITLTPKEDKVVEALQILEPTVNRISFTSRQTSNSGILLRLEGQENPIPLGSMGDGMRRILAIAACLVSVGRGTLLVDEIDTGLHYAVLKDMWKIIFDTARKQDAQVFASTHSWDCVEAFQQALTEYQDSEFGRLIRLDRKGNEVMAMPYLPDELKIAIAQDIEVR